jgi:hypothetical protein
MTTLSNRRTIVAHGRLAMRELRLDMARQRQHGVQIMSPNYEADPATPKIVPREQWFAPPARPEGKR